MNFIFILMCIVYGLCAIYFATKNDYTTICFFFDDHIVPEHYCDSVFGYSVINVDYNFLFDKRGNALPFYCLVCYQRKKNRGKKKRRDPCIFYCCNFCKEFICYRGIYFSSDNFTETVSYPLFRREFMTKS